MPVRSSGYNNNNQIVQAPGYVAMLQEQIHEVRIIPLDGRPHLGQSIRPWLGDSRGRWEGNTLVVETTNFHPESNYEGPIFEYACHEGNYGMVHLLKGARVLEAEAEEAKKQGR